MGSEKILLRTLLDNFLKESMLSAQALEKINTQVQTLYPTLCFRFDKDGALRVYKNNRKGGAFESAEEFVEYIERKVFQYNEKNGIANTNTIYINKKQVRNVANILSTRSYRNTKQENK